MQPSRFQEIQFLQKSSDIIKPKQTKTTLLISVDTAPEAVLGAALPRQTVSGTQPNQKVVVSRVKHNQREVFKWDV